MKTAGKIAKALAKICEVCCWIGAVVLAVVVPLLFFAGSEALTDNALLAQLGLAGIAPEHFESMMSAILVVVAGAAVLIVITALVFRNLHRALKLSCAGRPFHPNAVRCTRRMGWLLIAHFVLSLVWGGIATFMMADAISAIGASADMGVSFKVSTSASNVCLGLLALAVSQILEYGMKQQRKLRKLRANEGFKRPVRGAISFQRR